ncbi:putative ATP-binding cassette transporter [Chitinophaga eiseniae]|uniref:Putative ATP-binding cassette transporter n=1 Tax=Chitinophaga eiseniae TaxID=634771 RepID=A0A1T4TYB9_9BACT|nr:cyclic peptide export ABC transporter [Chitinophaga eiseniae]SKA45467.1 putative ATP-binding cassette transporter [Chitinophaga eiseniae]
MFRISIRNFFYLMLFCIPNTLLSVGILVIMNNIVSGKALMITAHQDITFFSLIAVSFVLNVIVQKKITSFSNKLIYENELRIMEKFQEAGLHQLERIGSQRIYGAIEDMRMLVLLPGMISTAITLVLTLLICIVYFFVVSAPSALFVIGLIAGIIGIYFAVNKKIAGKVHLLRQLNDNYFNLVDDILKGFKELKLSRTRRANLHEKYLKPNRADVRNTENYVANYLSVINLISQYGLYVIIGVVIFILPRLDLLSASEISAFVVVLLFVRGPINALTSMQTFFTKAFAANKRIVAFLKEMDALPGEGEVPGAAGRAEVLRELRFENISYKYPGAPTDAAYALQQLNLTVSGGEVIFIVGGNGSGKSTFVNILSGIYTPLEGRVLLNGKPILDDLQHYRDHIAAVFSDHHLFSANYEDYSLKNNEAYIALLGTMELNTIVKDDDEESARRKFSKGQSKRMALIYAMLEKRPLLVLDEWAADQDPHFRKYFYEQLLPKFRKQGKTIVAVTHDDAYFKHADRIIKFEYGNIVKDIQPDNSVLELRQL